MVQTRMEHYEYAVQIEAEASGCPKKGQLNPQMRYTVVKREDDVSRNTAIKVLSMARLCSQQQQKQPWMSETRAQYNLFYTGVS